MPSALQKELRQRRPFESAAHEAVLGLMRTADLIRRQAVALIEPDGITAQQYNVLRILRGAGNEGLPTLEVAERMIEQTPGVTRLFDRLQAQELGRSQRCHDDKGQHVCWITDKGLSLLAKLDIVTDGAHEEALKGLRHKDRVTFIRML